MTDPRRRDRRPFPPLARCDATARCGDAGADRRDRARSPSGDRRALRAGGKILLAGNGGSAADAQHIAAEFVGRFKFDRAPLPALALTTDTSALTAIGNDYGFEHVFARQVRGLGRPGDVFIGISTSGRSPNVLAALKAAREMRSRHASASPARRARDCGALCDHLLVAPADDTALIQQIHITAAHAICGMVERDCSTRRRADMRWRHSTEHRLPPSRRPFSTATA